MIERFIVSSVPSIAISTPLTATAAIAKTANAPIPVKAHATRAKNATRGIAVSPQKVVLSFGFQGLRSSSSFFSSFFFSAPSCEGLSSFFSASSFGVSFGLSSLGFSLGLTSLGFSPGFSSPGFSSPGFSSGFSSPGFSSPGFSSGFSSPSAAIAARIDFLNSSRSFFVAKSFKSSLVDNFSSCLLIALSASELVIFPSSTAFFKASNLPCVFVIPVFKPLIICSCSSMRFLSSAILPLVAAISVLRFVSSVFISCRRVLLACNVVTIAVKVTV